MLPMRIKGETRILAEAQDEYRSLVIRDEPHEDGNHMVSLWEPTPKELAALANGGFVRLTILGTIHPPVMVTVQSYGDTESELA